MRDDQIKEMIKVICEGCEVDHKHCYYLSNSELCPTVLNDSERLYNAGYRKQIEGEWIVVNEHSIRCSECCFNRAAIKIPLDFCPACGAKMKVGDRR